jgi:hypothetical protein
VILGTPDYDRWSWVALEWIYGKILPGAYAREHITHYTRKSLDQLIRAHGFEVLDCKYVGFSEMIFKAKKPPIAPDLQRMNYKTAAPRSPLYFMVGPSGSEHFYPCHNDRHDPLQGLRRRSMRPVGTPLDD